jgi:N-acetylmuramoyl-L-alanine amidase
MLIVAAHRLQGATVTHETTANHDGIIKPKFVVFHFTAISFAATVAVFKDPAPGNRVSAHLLIGRDGRIVQFLDFNLRAWHAGQSTWKGFADINSHSIGIELENAGSIHMDGERSIGEEGVIVPAEQVIDATHKHAKWTMTRWHQYAPAQLDACHDIAVILAKTYAIEDIVGHDDIAPNRKRDPGPAFPLESVRSMALGRPGIGLR